MKTRLILSVLAIVAISMSAMAGAGTLKVDADNSTVAWAAKKVGGAHDGHVKISEGSLIFDEGRLTGGSFVIDMNSITCADIENEKYNTKLVGHLKSPDFFGTETWPQAKLNITGVKMTGDNTYAVIGDLTIKETTERIEFITTIGETDGKTTATAEIEVDRTVFDVRYGSKKFFDNLGDKVIYDVFNLTVNLVEAK